MLMSLVERSADGRNFVIPAYARTSVIRKELRQSRIKMYPYGKTRPDLPQSVIKKSKASTRNLEVKYIAFKILKDVV